MDFNLDFSGLKPFFIDKFVKFSYGSIRQVITVLESGNIVVIISSVLVPITYRLNPPLMAESLRCRHCPLVEPGRGGRRGEDGCRRCTSTSLTLRGRRQDAASLLLWAAGTTVVTHRVTLWMAVRYFEWGAICI